MKARVEITARRRADANHQVVSATSSARLYRRVPCEQCPWRKDAPVGAFPAEAYRISAPTAYDMADSSFACHMAGTKAPTTCAGFLLRGAHHNMGVRMATMRGHIDLSQVDENGCDLYENYVEMAVANGVDPKDPALRNCRID